MTHSYQTAMEAVLARIKAANVTAVIGFLPPNGGVAIMAAGGDVKADMAGNAYASLRITVAAKATTQDGAVDLLDKAHSALRQHTASGETWSITGMHVVGAPQLAAQDAQGMWIVQSTARVKLLAENVEPEPAEGEDD